MPKVPRDADPRRVLRALRRLGFEVVSVEGGHYKLRRPNDPSLSLIVPFHGKMKTGTLASILREGRIRLETFLEVFLMP